MLDNVPDGNDGAPVSSTEHLRKLEPKLFMYGWLLEKAWRRLPYRLRNGLDEYLFRVSPSIPARLSTTSDDGIPWYAFRAGAGVTFVLCFAVTAAWSMLDGTWSGNDPERLYFSHDLADLIEYIFICPVYVGASVALVSLAIYRWSSLSDAAGMVKAAQREGRPAAAASIILVILVLAAVITTQFIKECLNPSVYGRTAWYVDRVTADGARVLSGLGLYYAILNYSLLVACLAGGSAYLALSLACIRVGHGIAACSTPKLTFHELQLRLSTFTSAYLLAKLLTGALICNVFTWELQHPKHSLNMKLLGLVLSIVGVFIVSVPRYYVELEWFRYKLRCSQNASPSDSAMAAIAEDIRPFSTKMAAHFIDTFLISGFIVSFISYWF